MPPDDEDELTLDEIENELRNRGALDRGAMGEERELAVEGPIEGTADLSYHDKSLAEQAPSMLTSIYTGAKGAQMGARAGAVLGPVGAAVGGFVGGVGGAAAGAFGSEELIERAKQAIGYSGAADPDVSATEAAGDAAFGEAITRGLFGTGGIVLKPFVRKVTPHAQSVINYLEKAFDRVINLQGGAEEAARAVSARVPGETATAELVGTVAGMPVQPGTATGSRFQQILTGLSEGSIIGGRRPGQFMRTEDGMLQLVKEDLGNKFGKAIDPADLGDLVFDSINGKINDAQAAIDIAWNQVDKLGAGASISIRPLHTARLGMETRAIIQKLGDRMDLPAALRMRAKLLKVKDPKAAHAIKILDGQIKRGAGTVSKDAADAVKYALKLEGGMAAKYQDRFIQKLINSHGSEGPRSVTKKILKTGDYTMFQKVFNAVDQATADQIRANVVSHVVEGSIVNGELRSSVMRSALNAIDGPTKKTLGKVVGQETKRDIYKFLDALELVESGRKAAKPGSTAIMLMQAAPFIAGGAAAGAIGGNILGITDYPTSVGGLSGGSAVLLLGPELIGQLMTRRGGAKLLTQSLTMPATAKNATNLINRLWAEKGLHEVMQTARDFGIMDPIPGSLQPDTSFLSDPASGLEEARDLAVGVE